MEEPSKTYTLTHSRDGWSVHFSTGIAPAFGLEQDYSLLEVIEYVKKLHPDYRPQLTVTQLADYAFQLQTDKITRQMVELREGLVDLTKRLPDLSVSQDRRDVADILAILHHQLSDLRAHLDIAKREVVLAKRMRQPENGMGRDGSRGRTVHALVRGMPPVRTAETSGMDR
jgi:hypothetical protein